MLRRLLVPLTALAVVLALVFAFLRPRDATTEPADVATYLSAEEGEAEDVAREVATLLLNYDGSNIEQRAEEVLPLATGAFREQYETIVGEGIGKALEEAEASSEGEILSGPSISFTSPSEAVALMDTRQTTRTRDEPDGRTFDYVWKLTLLKVEGQGWKANRLEILSQIAR